MCHNTQILNYYNPKTKTYDASKSFNFVSESLQSADFTLGNLETTIPTSTEDYSGYPRFGAPPEFVTALKNVGFDILSTANNHSADKGSIGIDNTIDTIFKNEMISIGTFKNQDDYQKRKHLILESNGIRIGILNYTYSTNGIKVPNGRIVRLLDQNLIQNDITSLRMQNIDFVILWYHFGTEYSIEPDQSQKEWVNIGFSLGADIIIGGHPHVVQKFERYTNSLSDSNPNDRFVMYSLGNFISAQNMPFTDGGVILEMLLELDSNRNRKIVSVNFEPVWVFPKGYQIIPILDYKNRKLEITLNKRDEDKMNTYLNTLSSVLGITF